MSPSSNDFGLSRGRRKARRIGFVITVGGVHYYLTRLKLAPHETRAIDLGQLRDQQRPDFKGHKPRTAILCP
jgi:hypothetical protein